MLYLKRSSLEYTYLQRGTLTEEKQNRRQQPDMNRLAAPNHLNPTEAIAPVVISNGTIRLQFSHDIVAFLRR